MPRRDGAAGRRARRGRGGMQAAMHVLHVTPFSNRLTVSGTEKLVLIHRTAAPHPSGAQHMPTLDGGLGGGRWAGASLLTCPLVSVGPGGGTAWGGSVGGG
eukprot:COSAG02_NODE_7007_length_3229_cov_18.793610_4_plen_101_part_00